MTILGILGGIAALLFGIYWGMPVRYDQSIDDIDERLGEEGRHRKAKRHMTFLNLLQRKTERGSHRRRSARRERTPFRY